MAHTPLRGHTLLLRTRQRRWVDGSSQVVADIKGVLFLGWEGAQRAYTESFPLMKTTQEAWKIDEQKDLLLESWRDWGSKKNKKNNRRSNDCRRRTCILPVSGFSVSPLRALCRQIYLKPHSPAHAPFTISAPFTCEPITHMESFTKSAVHSVSLSLYSSRVFPLTLKKEAEITTYWDVCIV